MVTMSRRSIDVENCQTEFSMLLRIQDVLDVRHRRSTISNTGDCAGKERLLASVHDLGETESSGYYIVMGYVLSDGVRARRHASRPNSEEGFR